MRKGIPNQAYANTSKVEEVRMREKEEEIRGKHSRPIQLNRTTQTNLNGKREKNEKRKKKKRSPDPHFSTQNFDKVYIPFCKNHIMKSHHYYPLYTYMNSRDKK
jgi:hypothetical protein